MSIEKLSSDSRTEIEQCPFAQIPNSVINQIKDNDAFRLYAYLLSKSLDWEVIKTWTRDQCGVGQRKAEQCWAYLERCGLLMYVQIRDEHGKFIKHDLRILNGSKFKPDEPFLKAKKPTAANSAGVGEVEPSHSCKNPLSGETTAVDFAVLLNKDSTKQKSYKNKESYTEPNNDQCQSNEKIKKRSLVLQTYPKDFFPDERRMRLLIQVANKTNTTEYELINKFEEVSVKYKTRSKDWQQAFEDFINRELPKKVYETSTGSRKRYDNRSLYD